MSATAPHITYSPLVDHRHRMTGVHLRVHCGSLGPAALSMHLNRLDGDWPISFPLVLVEFAPLGAATWPTGWRPPASSTVVTRLPPMLTDPGWLALADLSTRVCLPASSTAPGTAGAEDFLGATPVDLAQLKSGVGLTAGPALLGLDCDEPIDAVHAEKHGAIAWSGWSCMQWKRKPADRKVGMLATLLKVIHLINRDAASADIEAILKRDATLSYKLIAVANSAAYGLAVEVASVRHAMSIVGREKLKRWFALMLVQSGGDTPQVLLQTAFARASFLQTIGSALEIDGAQEDLFLCGAFSLLDRILGIPIGDVLSRVSISDAITDALMDNSGALGPLIKLMYSVENREPIEVSRLCDELSLDPMLVNQALLGALGSVTDPSAM